MNTGENDNDEVYLLMLLRYFVQVLAEIDVCLAGNLVESLHFLQYPLRPNYREYGDQGELVKVEVGLKSQQPHLSL